MLVRRQPLGSRAAWSDQGWQKGFLYKNRFLGFMFSKVKLQNAGHKIMTDKQRFSHVNATNRNSYFEYHLY